MHGSFYYTSCAMDHAGNFARAQASFDGRDEEVFARAAEETTVDIDEAAHIMFEIAEKTKFSGNRCLPRPSDRTTRSNYRPGNDSKYVSANKTLAECDIREEAHEAMAKAPPTMMKAPRTRNGSTVVSGQPSTQTTTSSANASTMQPVSCSQICTTSRGAVQTTTMSFTRQAVRPAVCPSIPATPAMPSMTRCISPVKSPERLQIASPRNLQQSLPVDRVSIPATPAMPSVTRCGSPERPPESGNLLQSAPLNISNTSQIPIIPSMARCTSPTRPQKLRNVATHGSFESVARGGEQTPPTPVVSSATRCNSPKRDGCLQKPTVERALSFDCPVTLRKAGSTPARSFTTRRQLSPSERRLLNSPRALHQAQSFPPKQIQASAHFRFPADGIIHLETPAASQRDTFSFEEATPPQVAMLPKKLDFDRKQSPRKSLVTNCISREVSIDAADKSLTSVILRQPASSMPAPKETVHPAVRARAESPTIERALSCDCTSTFPRRCSFSPIRRSAVVDRDLSLAMHRSNAVASLHGRCASPLRTNQQRSLSPTPVRLPQQDFSAPHAPSFAIGTAQLPCKETRPLRLQPPSPPDCNLKTGNLQPQLSLATAKSTSTSTTASTPHSLATASTIYRPSQGIFDNAFKRALNAWEEARV